MNTSQGILDCSACEQKILDASDPRDALRDSSVSNHLASCPECREFMECLGAVKPVLDRYQVLEPTEALMDTVINRTFQVQPSRQVAEKAPLTAGMFRVLLAGLVSLPLVILINALMGWALYEVAVSLLPRTIAVYFVGLFVVWASMAVSFGYASLPLLDALVKRPVGRLPAMADP